MNAPASFAQNKRNGPVKTGNTFNIATPTSPTSMSNLMAYPKTAVLGLALPPVDI
jgi:hypothetical protein